jgi:3-deoxy-7-phosphoheptulonate synthase
MLRPNHIDDEKFKLTNRLYHPEDTVVKVGKYQIGGNSITIIAGPCSVESREQINRTADGVKRAGAHLLRGGAYKPRTSPYDFQGLKEVGLELLKESRERTGMPIVTEVVSPELVEKVSEYADLLQIGARNMQNYELLKEVGQANKPVLLKRGISATIEEFLLAAEYIIFSGNENVILCERGIRTFEKYTRNTLDLSAVALIKQMSHLPVIVDPSHASGRKDLIIPLAKAAIAAGADGVMVEVHHQPELALSDGLQSLTLEMFGEMMSEVRKIADAIGRPIPLDDPAFE